MVVDVRDVADRLIAAAEKGRRGETYILSGQKILVRYLLEVLQCNSNISHAKATHELGYRPRPLYDSIRDAVKWFLEKK